MRIGISCNSFGAGGGLERYALDITRAISARTDEPVIVYARDFEAGQAARAGIEAHRIDVSWVPRKLRDHAFSYALQRERRSCHAAEVLIGCNRVRGSDIAICGGTHRGYLRARNKLAGPLDRWRIRLEAGQYAGAARVVAHSRMMQSELRALYGVPEHRISLLYPPVDTGRFAPVTAAERQALRKQYGFGDELVFLFPSSDHRRKGLDALIPHFSHSGPSITLAVAGRPVPGNPPGVRSLGYCRDIEDLYRAADFTILASAYEPFGLVGVESVLCGTPLVFADNIACLEIIRPEAVEVFSRAAPDSVRTAIERAVARARAGRARLPDPQAMLGYDPEPAAHAQALLELCRAIAAKQSTYKA
jgi:glycosyltransferase involved in cell wall biosynthesis